MVFEGEQSKNDKLQFIEAGASHDNSPDEGEEEEDLVQAGVVEIFVKRIMRSVCVAFQTIFFVHSTGSFLFVTVRFICILL